MNTNIEQLLLFSPPDATQSATSSDDVGEFTATTSRLRDTGSVERRFETVPQSKSNGVTYTPASLASFVAQQIVNRIDADPRSLLRIFDPAVGQGELLLALLTELSGRGYYCIEVEGMDVDSDVLAITKDRLEAAFPGISIRMVCCDFLVSVDKWSNNTPVQFDAIIANPPYVRTQILGAEAAQKLALRFGLRGRIDLYQAFSLALAELLLPRGVLGLIVSNRFLTTKGASTFRSLFMERYQIEHIWDLGDTKLFDAAVLPAVVVAKPTSCEDTSRTVPVFSSIYQTASVPVCTEVPNIAAALSETGVVVLPDGRHFMVRHGRLDTGSSASEIWRLSAPESDSWLKNVYSMTWKTFGDIGKIRVGVKTTADAIFIRDDWDTLPLDEMPELLKPLTTHRVGRRYVPNFRMNRRMILYPYRVENGIRRTVILAEVPKSALYLEKHREKLTSRKYIIDAKRQWYEIWVPQDPNAWLQPKLVFKDITDAPVFWVDRTGSVINGDCYWMILAPEFSAQEELLRLACAVGNSSFVEFYYDRRFNNKLYSGRRRFITQYVEQFPLPEPTNAASQKIIALVGIIEQMLGPTSEANTVALETEVDSLVWEAFGLCAEKIQGNRNL